MDRPPRRRRRGRGAGIVLGSITVGSAEPFRRRGGGSRTAGREVAPPRRPDLPGTSDPGRAKGGPVRLDPSGGWAGTVGFEPTTPGLGIRCTDPGCATCPGSPSRPPLSAFPEPTVVVSRAPPGEGPKGRTSGSRLSIPGTGWRDGGAAVGATAGCPPPARLPPPPRGIRADRRALPDRSGAFPSRPRFRSFATAHR